MKLHEMSKNDAQLMLPTIGQLFAQVAHSKRHLSGPFAKASRGIFALANAYRNDDRIMIRKAARRVRRHLHAALEIDRETTVEKLNVAQRLFAPRGSTAQG
jgi:hypothetical protein